MADETTTPTPPQVKGPSKIVPILLVFNSLLIAGVIAVVFLKKNDAAKGGHEAAASHESKEGAEPAAGEHGGAMGPTVKLPDFVIHLRNPEADRYARVSFEIEVANDKDKEEITTYLPKLREAFIVYLSDRTIEDLSGGEGIDKTKRALFEKMTTLMSKRPPKALYITDLVIQ